MPPTETFIITLYSATDFRVLFLAFRWLQDVSNAFTWRLVTTNTNTDSGVINTEVDKARAAEEKAKALRTATAPASFDVVWRGREASEKALRSEAAQFESLWRVAYGGVSRNKLEETMSGKVKECEGKRGSGEAVVMADS
ncbi:hypothetical protein LTS18_013096 [Coniosporium uncinatum]|uniref:Uncharacterized protein n=1 Tax=Coniosporium uncinatum TaxID=93489 RepID=A0ACC3DYY7_9PEZI|nr:hypothetical protein LTS18_013096 [Coniosporium uncinatum]